MKLKNFQNVLKIITILISGYKNTLWKKIKEKINTSFQNSPLATYLAESGNEENQPTFYENTNFTDVLKTLQQKVPNDHLEQNHHLRFLISVALLEQKFLEQEIKDKVVHNYLQDRELPKLKLLAEQDNVPADQNTDFDLLWESIKKQAYLDSINSTIKNVEAIITEFASHPFFRPAIIDQIREIQCNASTGLPSDTLVQKHEELQELSKRLGGNRKELYTFLTNKSKDKKQKLYRYLWEDFTNSYHKDKFLMLYNGLSKDNIWYKKLDFIKHDLENLSKQNNGFEILELLDRIIPKYKIILLHRLTYLIEHVTNLKIAYLEKFLSKALIRN